MSELSNAVTVLIARMESHPEDFDLRTGGLYSSTKFGDVAGALYGLVGMDAGKAGAYWFLSDADKEALIEAWKKYHRTAMEKEVMGKIFDDGSEERDRKAAYISGMKASMQQQVQAAQNLYPAQNSAQGMAIQGSSYNGGLLGQAGNAFSGLFK